MIIQQLSVFLENKPGRLCAAVDTLSKEGIDISALTVADTSEFGILRMIVDQPERAREVLMASGVIVRITKVIAVAMNDTPGGAGTVLHLLSNAYFVHLFLCLYFVLLIMHKINLYMAHKV